MKSITTSASSFVQRLFQFSSSNHSKHRKFVEEMILGILGSQSTLLSNIARLSGGTFLSNHRRFRRMLKNVHIPWEELRLRVLELGSMQMKEDDIVAFDPGDITEKYAKKMEDLYPVYDGSKGTSSLGYEEFAVEAISWHQREKIHIPLFQKITNAKRRDYVSQNHQILEAIHSIFSYTGRKGIWVFDRGHDRLKILKEGLLPLSKQGMRWILRVKENRSVIPTSKEVREIYLPKRTYFMGMVDLANQIPLSDETRQLLFPQKSAPLRLGWEKVTLVEDPEERELTLLGYSLFMTTEMSNQ